mmetsp:Transcript_25488/g.35880  ORF Transcript_25488/g.35880 Transcript_25488/m.35880 type:complete len:199 (-) Transcript_25488:76-672(-)
MVKNSGTASLSASGASSVILYDPEAILDVNREVARGFAVLLSGGVYNESFILESTGRRRSKGRKNSSPLELVPNIDQPTEVDENTLMLAFMALIDGNVVDACFGVIHQRRDASSPAFRRVQDAKIMLSNASDTSDSIRSLAVETYHKAFLIVIDYNDQMDKANCCTRCARQKKIHRNAKNALHGVFEQLQEAITNSTQ